MNPMKIFYSQGHQTLESNVGHPTFKNIIVSKCSWLFLYNFHKFLNIYVIHKETLYVYKSNAWDFSSSL